MMTSTEVDNGLVLPYVVQTVAGKAGAGALLLTIFMVCRSKDDWVLKKMLTEN